MNLIFSEMILKEMLWKRIILPSIKIQLFFSTVLSYSEFNTKIPNGNKIFNPCNSTLKWKGVGHENSSGKGPLNNFGKDFLVNGKQWTHELCKKDSDNDGKSNGEELGDPNCTWQFGAAAEGGKISHPGICEPVNSKHCRQQPGNNFLESLDTCADFLGNSASNWCPDATEDPTVKTLELRFDQFNIGSNDTYYMCQTFEVPSDQDYHIIAWEPIITNRDIYHRLTLFTCNSQEDEDSLVESSEFLKPEPCEMASSVCFNIAMVWTICQAEGRCYPNDTGILMGPSTFRRVILQHHYHRKNGMTDLTDSSGIRVYYTAKFRQIDTSMIVVGQNEIEIPPEKKSVTVTASAFLSSSVCSHVFTRNNSYHFSSLFIHMHQLAIHANLKILKANGRVETIFDEDVTYGEPTVVTWYSYDNSPILEPGDDIRIECTYSSVGKDDFTFFGASIHDEMCYAFIEVTGRPWDESFHWLANFRKNINMCSYLGWNITAEDRNFDGCSYHKLWYVWNVMLQNPRRGGFLENCNHQNFQCSTSCKRTVDDSQLDYGDACLGGSLLKQFLAEDGATPKEQFTVSSEVKSCILAHASAQRNAATFPNEKTSILKQIYLYIPVLALCQKKLN